jgi:hypothetical protein
MFLVLQTIFDMAIVKQKTQNFMAPRGAIYICNVIVLVVVGYMYKYTKFIGL